MSKKLITLSIICLLAVNVLKAQHITSLQEGTRTSLRGLSVVDDKVAWASGSKGNIAVTTDGGKTWAWQQVKGFEKADFRDIEGFSDKDAVVMSSGSPALILKTTDGGANWKVTYKNTDTAYFLDAMDFFGSIKQQGWVLGDPINGQFLLMMSPDGGSTWRQYKNSPNALPGEAAFAASGTCFRTIDRDMWIVSGGTSANIITSNNATKEWNTIKLPLAQGRSSKGGFALAKGVYAMVAVGGNYAKDKDSDSTACYSTDYGKTWVLADKTPAGFQSGVELIKDNTFISTGTSGSNVTKNGGKTWTKFDGTSYNVCRKAKNGTLVLFAGDGGKIGVLEP